MISAMLSWDEYVLFSTHDDAAATPEGTPMADITEGEHVTCV